MRFKERFYALYLIFPYLTTYPQIKNRFSFIKSLLFNKFCIIKFKNGIQYSIEVSDYNTILRLLSIERYSQSFQIDGKYVKISFDNINKFKITTSKLSKEDKILLNLLDLGLKDGAIFIDENHDAKIKYEKNVKIIQNKQCLIETSEGIKFFLDSIGPTPFVETFVKRIHNQYSNDLMGKVVIDVGAANGDTPLYFASKGASVYAFEMTKSNFDEMIKNLELNPVLAKTITPIHAAIGKDGNIKYHQDSLERVSTHGGASFLINKYGAKSISHNVQGMSLKTILKKFKISQVDLLKLDCKGCEFFLKKDELDSVKRIKIEYYSQMKSQNIDSILNMLKELNFNSIIFKHTTQDTSPLKIHGNILAEKK